MTPLSFLCCTLLMLAATASARGERAGTYPKLEASFELAGVTGNPFNDGENDVRVTFRDEIITAAEQSGVDLQFGLQHHGQYSSRALDSRTIKYLTREFGRAILTETPWRAMPRNKQLTLPELVNLFRYHYCRYWEREYQDSNGDRKWPEQREFHLELLRNFRSNLLRYGFHGYGNPMGVRVRLAMTGDWRPDGHREGEDFPERGGWEVTQFHGVCFVSIAITQFEIYGQVGPGAQD